ncbi:MAG TPA: Uma2 family endonuclease [Stellaceae bacterium]|nr:Uma2 family endonuclease [Stellaceae bacterium]
MSVPNTPMSVAQFLEWEARQPTRHEFDGVRPVAMVGGTRAHATIQRNLAISVGGRLLGGPCAFYGSDLKIRTAGDTVRYPDGFVTCTSGTARDTVVGDPVVIFEVLSDSTATTDFREKNGEYAATPSVRRYVMLYQDKIAAVMFERGGDDWIGHLLAPDSVLMMPEIGIELPLAELYRGVEMAGEVKGEEEG